MPVRVLRPDWPLVAFYCVCIAVGLTFLLRLIPEDDEDARRFTVVYLAVAVFLLLRSLLRRRRG